MTHSYSYQIYVRKSTAEDWRWLAGGFSTEEEARSTLDNILLSSESTDKSYKFTRIVSFEEDVV